MLSALVAILVALVSISALLAAMLPALVAILAALVSISALLAVMLSAFSLMAESKATSAPVNVVA